MSARGQRILKRLAALPARPPLIRVVLDGADSADPEAWLFGEPPDGTGRPVRVVMPAVDRAAQAHAEAGLPDAYHRHRADVLAEVPAKAPAVPQRTPAAPVVVLAPSPAWVPPEVADLARRVLAAATDTAKRAVAAEVAAAAAAAQAAVLAEVRRMRHAGGQAK